MYRRRKGMIAIIVLLLFVGIAAGCSGWNKEEMQKAEGEEIRVEDADTFEKLKSYFLYTDSYDHTKELKQMWEKKEKKKILNEHDSDKNGDGIFVRACFLLEENNKEAAKKFHEVLKKTKDNKVKARCYFELSRIYGQNNAYDKAEKEWNNMQKLLKEEEDDASFLILLNTQGYADLLDWPNGVNKAVSLMEETKDLAEAHGYEKKEEVMSGLAICYYYAGEELKGMEAKVEGLSLAEEHKNTDMIRKISADIGIDYMVAEDYDRAIEYLKRSENSILKQKKESQELLQFHIYVVNNLFLSYMGKKDMDQAWNYLTQAKTLIEKEEDGKRKTDDCTYYMTNKAQYYIEIKEYDKALSLMDKVKKRYEKTDYFYYTNFDIGYREVYGELYNGKKEYEKALEYWNEVVNLYKKQGVDTPDTSCLGGLYKAYYGLGDYKNALKYKNKMYEEISESFKGKEKEHSNFLLEKFESDKREKEINSLQTRNRILWIVVGLVLVFLLVTLLFVLLIVRKSNEIRRLNQKLQDLSEKDGLTGLYNRRAMDAYLEKNWRRLSETYENICVMMLDVDYFKKYNDFYGHQGGDEVLRKVSHVIIGACRKEDMAIRYGGEEFAVILPGATLEQAGQIAENIRSGVRELAILHEKSEVSDRVSISSGVARAETGCSSEQALKDADDALYEAKKKRDTVYVLETKEK